MRLMSFLPSNQQYRCTEVKNENQRSLHYRHKPSGPYTITYCRVRVFYRLFSRVLYADRNAQFNENRLYATVFSVGALYQSFNTISTVASQPMDEGGQSPGAPETLGAPEYLSIFFCWRTTHTILTYS